MGGSKGRRENLTAPLEAEFKSCYRSGCEFEPSELYPRTARTCKAITMAAEKTDAIVLRVIDFSETSCVVTLMTRDFGKITALAKGARRRKSPFEAALDLLSVCRIVFLRKTSGAMDLLTEAKLQRRFRTCLLYTSPSPRDATLSRMPSSA